jgi:tRNA 2-thiouridine synthesizing protein E
LNLCRTEMTETACVPPSFPVALDPDGYLLNLDDWSEAVACSLAANAAIELTAAHWEILHLVRAFHARRSVSPVMRVLVKIVKNELGPDKGNSLYLLRLFPESPALLASRIAGLPRPSNCL